MSRALPYKQPPTARGGLCIRSSPLRGSGNLQFWAEVGSWVGLALICIGAKPKHGTRREEPPGLREIVCGGQTTWATPRSRRNNKPPLFENALGQRRVCAGGPAVQAPRARCALDKNIRHARAAKSVVVILLFGATRPDYVLRVHPSETMLDFTRMSRA